jgi:hypothetical protein
MGVDGARRYLTGLDTNAMASGSAERHAARLDCHASEGEAGRWAITVASVGAGCTTALSRLLCRGLASRALSAVHVSTVHYGHAPWRVQTDLTWT